MRINLIIWWVHALFAGQIIFLKVIVSYFSDTFMLDKINNSWLLYKQILYIMHNLENLKEIKQPIKFSILNSFSYMALKDIK